ncbi:uncharacterized protein GIQ15_04979 [Arthroderma uncinatum]|uniref:uncharacterized protein n=1 Tax=Arthroderma uncinatum TaxID=74035 RepID=UPI00144AA047|nr:uncharacterized protein GIQ15_04979 [Arthroderma uncinatum]KAF3482220.1 hypothetical protein GIQ15_04979 [Arthroderma uncinatum]
MQFSKLIAILPALLAVPVFGQLDVYAHPCSDCKCNGAFLHQFKNGDDPNHCYNINVGFGPYSVGLKGGDSVSCQMYHSSDCSGLQQSVGIKKGQSYGCTGTQIGSFGSYKCTTGK